MQSDTMFCSFNQNIVQRTRRQTNRRTLKDDEHIKTQNCFNRIQRVSLVASQFRGCILCRRGLHQQLRLNQSLYKMRQPGVKSISCFCHQVILSFCLPGKRKHRFKQTCCCYYSTYKLTIILSSYYHHHTTYNYITVSGPVTWLCWLKSRITTSTRSLVPLACLIAQELRKQYSHHHRHVYTIEMEEQVYSGQYLLQPALYQDTIIM